MADKSPIEWTDATWNPIVGCSILSPGCTNCYAMRMAARIEAMGGAPHYAGTTKKVNGNAVWTGKLALAPGRILTQPLRWKEPRRIFVNSMGDLFHEDVPDAWIDRVFAVMARAPHHTFQVLTKRARRMREYCDNRGGGVSRRVSKVAPSTPAAIRFVSAEPLLGPIDFTSICTGHYFIDALRGFKYHDAPEGVHSATEPCAKLDQIIVGGESGHQARPMHPRWPRWIRDHCASAGTAFFFKQWGAWAPSTPEKAAGNPRSGWRCLAAHPHVPHRAELYPEAGAEFIEHLGKKAAGRLLDGIEHDGMPEAR
ncbi:phage Gp37/Gp68 family protein [Mesorhizobium sp. B3-1-9]|uniref:DUF5131 family protein n=1 Tax=Mesorhizobium sp. B3-1-9 TaxID=2589892 RepID=UPI00112B7806|nr:phage Gp37/Gp68 family protein [Mesorhizobium sp. B3-1-9]TPI39280.1 phage Gp37/Gp68 family protein [Mesorhizobium sp. B3-1-9]